MPFFIIASQLTEPEFISLFFSWFALGNFFIAFVSPPLSPTRSIADFSGGLDGETTLLSHDPVTDLVELAQPARRRLEICQHPFTVWICGSPASVLLASSWKQTCGVSHPLFVRQPRCETNDVRSVVGYTISMIGFALLTVYMLFAAGTSFFRFFGPGRELTYQCIWPYLVFRMLRSKA